MSSRYRPNRNVTIQFTRMAEDRVLDLSILLIEQNLAFALKHADYPYNKEGLFIIRPPGITGKLRDKVALLGRLNFHQKDSRTR